MTGRKFWQSLISLVRLRKSANAKRYTFIPSCHVYLRENGVWVFPMNVRGGSGGGIGVMVGPADMVKNEMPDQALGEAVIATISRSRFEAWDFKTPLPDSKAPESAGFKGYGDLERGARLLRVSRKGDQFTISAWNASKNGGYGPIPGAEKTCQNDPSTIGKAIRDLSERCVVRTIKTRKRDANEVNRPQEPNSDADDAPEPFGYKISWIVVTSSDGRAVAKSLGLRDVRHCSWKEGVELAYAGKSTFVTPTVEGWTIALGPHPEAGQASFLPRLEDLSREFGEAFYFGTHRIVGYQAWGRAKQGKIVRAFGYLGERGQFLINVGDRTPEEIELGTGVEDVNCEPDEETVLNLAGMWVLDPREIDLHTSATGPGLIGTAK
jgi:hypothetical protein